MESMRVLGSAEEVLAALRTAGYCNSAFRAFYSSRLNAIVTDPALMRVPIDDHIVHRSHAVGDALLVSGGRVYLLQQHLQRLAVRAKEMRIDLPVPIQRVGSVLKEVARAAGIETGKVRYWLTSGPGNMAIWPEPGMSTLYALAVSEDWNGLKVSQGIAEVTVEVQMKAAAVPAIRHTNTLLDVLSTFRAQEEGGSHGIRVTTDGEVCDCAFGHLCFLLPSKRLVVPPFNPFTNHTLIARILEHAQCLQQSEELASVEVRKITVAEAKTAEEVLKCTGDSLVPIVQWDKVPVGTGSPGAIYSIIRQRLFSEVCDPTYSDVLSLA